MDTNSCDAIKPRQTRRIGPTRRSVSGLYPFRGESSIPYESTLERDFLIRKEFSLSVLDVIAQPCQIPFKDKLGRSSTYTPDFLVYYRLGSFAYPDYPKPMLVEVKPDAEWRKHWRRWLPKWKAAYRYAIEHGWVFHIHDEGRIRDTALSNIRFLERYQRIDHDSTDARVVLETVAQMGGTPIHYLLARYFMGIYRRRGLILIWHLLATRKLDCDISGSLDEHTTVWVSTDE